MNILIIGGTGFFGRDIVELALDAGHQVTIFSRGNEQPDFWDRVAHIAGDRTDKVDFANKLANKQFDAVIDNIAFNGEDAKNALDLFRGNIGRYVLTTSGAVYLSADPFDQPWSEEDANYERSEFPEFTSGPVPASEWMIGYAAGKIEAEKSVVEQDGIPYTIIRPPNVIGPEDPTGRSQFYFQRLLDGGPLILTNGGVQSTQPVFSRDLARAYLLALESAKATNQVYNVTQTKTSQLVEWVVLAARTLGAPANLVPVPADVMRNSGFQYAEDWTYTSTLTFDSTKAVKDLGFRPIPIEEWTTEVARWYLESTHKEDSPGYADRAKEIAFAEKYLEKIGELASYGESTY